MNEETKIEFIPIPQEILALLHRILDQNNEILRINAQLLREIGSPMALATEKKQMDEHLRAFFRK